MGGLELDDGGRVCLSPGNGHDAWISCMRRRLYSATARKSRQVTFTHCGVCAVHLDYDGSLHERCLNCTVSGNGCAARVELGSATNLLRPFASSKTPAVPDCLPAYSTSRAIVARQRLPFHRLVGNPSSVSPVHQAAMIRQYHQGYSSKCGTLHVS